MFPWNRAESTAPRSKSGRKIIPNPASGSGVALALYGASSSQIDQSRAQPSGRRSGSLERYDHRLARSTAAALHASSDVCDAVRRSPPQGISERSSLSLGSTFANDRVASLTTAALESSNELSKPIGTHPLPQPWRNVDAPMRPPVQQHCDDYYHQEKATAGAPMRPPVQQHSSAQYVQESSTYDPKRSVRATHGHYRIGGGTQNQGNVLGSRSCVRQSKLYREYESGNVMKSILGVGGSEWKTDVLEGAYAGQPIYDHRNSMY